MKRFMLILAFFLGACSANQTPNYAAVPEQFQSNSTDNCTYYYAGRDRRGRTGNYWIINCNGFWYYL